MVGKVNLKRKIARLFVVIFLVNSTIFIPSTNSHATTVCPNLDSYSANFSSTPILWLRSDCVNGVGATNPADGTSITRWEDVSGNNNDATVVSGKVSPTLQSDTANLINGQPVLNFSRDGAGTILEVPNVDIRATTMPDVSIFVVYKTRHSNASEDLGVFGNDNGNWDRFFLARYSGYGSSSDGLISLGPSSGNTTATRLTNAGVNESTKVLTAVYDGSVSGGTNSGPTNASRIYFGGTLAKTFTDQTAATAAQTKLFIGWDGDNSVFRGDIVEFIVFNEALTAPVVITVNEVLNEQYDLGLPISTNLPDVLLADPKVASVNFATLDLSLSTNAMICFSQVLNSSGSALGGSPTISISRTSSVAGVTENTDTNLWRYSGAIGAVQDQINSIIVSGAPAPAKVAPTSSKWLKVHVTSAITSATDCTDSQVDKVVEIRSLIMTTKRIINNISVS